MLDLRNCDNMELMAEFPDNHFGYAEENWLEVKFICVTCDGKQLRKRKNEM